MQESYSDLLTTFIEKLPIGASGSISLVLGDARIETWVHKDAPTVEREVEVPPSLAALAEMERQLESTTGHAARLARFLDEILIANEEYIRSNTAGSKSLIKYQAMEKKTARIRELLKLPVRAKLPECSICGSLDHERAACPESEDDDLCSDCPGEGLPDTSRCLPCPRRKKEEFVAADDQQESEMQFIKELSDARLVENQILHKYLSDLLRANDEYLLSVKPPVLDPKVSIEAFEMMENQTVQIRSILASPRGTPVLVCDYCGGYGHWSSSCKRQAAAIEEGKIQGGVGGRASNAELRDGQLWGAGGGGGSFTSEGVIVSTTGGGGSRPQED